MSRARCPGHVIVIFIYLVIICYEQLQNERACDPYLPPLRRVLRDLTNDVHIGHPLSQPAWHFVHIKATVGYPTWQVGQVLFRCEGSSARNITGISAHDRRWVTDGRTGAVLCWVKSDGVGPVLFLEVILLAAVQ